MRKRRLKALEHFDARPMPWWGADLSDIDFANIFYFIRSTEKMAANWEDLPDDIKGTWDKLGIPEAEKKYLGGVSAQYESEVVYHKIKKELDDIGVLFTDMDSALRDYPDLVKEHFGTIIPSNDNKFAALNTAVWSGGSFIYVPPGVQVDIPLQAYFRINAENMGQFERTLIIADEGSYVHYVEGCSAPIYSSDSLHSAVVEIKAMKGARVRYTTIQNWSTNVYNLVTKRAAAYEDAVMEWVDGNIGSKVTMKYPSIYLLGEGARGEILSVAFAGKGMHTDAGGKAIHAAPHTTSVINSKSVSKDGGRTGYRGLVRVEPDAHHAKSHGALRRADPGRRVAFRHLPLHRGGGRDGVAGPRGHGLQGRRRPALLSDEPRSVRGRGDRDDRQRIHRADHARAADGVRGRAEPPDRAADGGLRRMTTFDRAALEALPIAPGFTGAIRARAFEQFEALPTPSQETEEWRYTDLSAFELDFVPHMPGHGHGVPRARRCRDRGHDAASQLEQRHDHVRTGRGDQRASCSAIWMWPPRSTPSWSSRTCTPWCRRIEPGSRRCTPRSERAAPSSTCPPTWRSRCRCRR